MLNRRRGIYKSLRSNLQLATLILVAVSGLSSCESSAGLESDVRDIFSSPATVAPVSASDLDLDDRIPTWDYPDLVHADGSITRMMWLKAGEAENYLKLVERTSSFQEKRIQASVVPGFLKQKRRSSEGRILPNEEGNLPALDALMLVGPKADVEATADFVVAIQRSIPQIDVGIRVVEVLETDAFSFGIDTFFQSVERDNSKPTASFFDQAGTALGLPDLPGRGATFTGGDATTPLLLDLGTISNGVRIDFIIRALKLFTKTDILSAPHIAVLDGHAAEITAGEEIPFFTPVFNVSGIQNVVTQFKRVGIKLFVTPTVIGRNVIRIALTTAVESVTGESSFESSGVTVSNPIITVRQASTEMDVYDGDTAIIGGLLTHSKLDNENKIPILGDLPVLSFFFKSRSKQTFQSNLIFFITPKIMDPTRDRNRIITPSPVPAAPGGTATENLPGE